MFSDEFEEAFECFLNKVKNTAEYINYKTTFNAIQDDDKALGCVESIRELNMRVMDMDEDEYERESESIASRMEELCSDSRVSDFILAEVEFSKMYQYITDKIVSALDEE